MPDDFLHSGLGGQFRQWRRREGFRQADVAARAGVSLPTVRLLERDGGLVLTFHRILDAFELRIVGRGLPQGEHVGLQLALLRKRRRISQRRLAAMLGVCQDTVIDLEHGGGRLATLGRALMILGAGAYLAHRSEAKAFYVHAGNSMVSNEWTTPPWVMQRLIDACGRFDLDPCSSLLHPITRAKVVFTPDDDGLALPWFGAVFVNPPYGRGIGDWIDKAIAEFSSRRVSSIIALVPARTDSRWWRRAVSSGAGVLFLKGRLKFGDGGQSAPFPSSLVVWGASSESFASVQRAFPDAIGFFQPMVS